MELFGPHSKGVSVSDARAVPSSWLLATDEGVDGDREPWRMFYDQLRPTHRLLREQAEEFVRNLRKAIRLDKDLTVLDFGCGCGLVTELIAPLVGNVFMWDYSANMRRFAREATRNLKNVHYLDLEQADNGSTGLTEHKFDVILANSVVQYMTSQELSRWLDRWRGMLMLRGKLLISDVMPSDAVHLHDLADYVIFCLRKGLVFQAMRMFLSEFRLYHEVRKDHQLTVVSRAELHQKAESTGFDVTFLAVNLTHFRSRYAALLSHSAVSFEGRGTP